MINGGIFKPIFPYFADSLNLKPDLHHMKMSRIKYHLVYGGTWL